MSHKAGFINIIGKPNSGKSTLINALTGRKVAIVTPKPQTTRHRILGIVSSKEYQMVFSDTPGVLKPRYEMHRAMMRFVELAIEDADILIYMVTAGENPDDDRQLLAKVKKSNVPVILLINKVDLSDQTSVMENMEKWKEHFDDEDIIPVSALKTFNLERLKQRILSLLPESPPYYEEDVYTDKTERFLVSEIIREKIFMFYREEIPYSVEVGVTEFKDKPDILHIHADIWVNRKSQKPILIGNKGDGLKRVGTAARKELEEFFEKKIYLELYVKVKENWRENPGALRQFGME